jgi:hypothetical protein
MPVAQAVSRRFVAGLLMGAGGLLAAACAMQPTPVAVDFDVARAPRSAAPRSTLVTRQDLKFTLAREQRDKSEVTFLVHEAASGAPLPVAAIVSSASGTVHSVSMQRLRLPEGADTGDLEIAILEHLYVLAVQQDPQASFCLSRPGEGCDTRNGESHAALLRELVETRQRALQAKHGGKPGAPWHVVSMAPSAVRAHDADDVAVSVATDGKPLAGANVFFSRAPHSGCAAKSDARGLARCELVDYHGDDGDGDGANTPVVATYSGDVRTARVLVPTTFVLPLRPADALAKGTK